MMRLSITLKYEDHKLIEHHARKNNVSISKAARTLIRNGMLFDIPERKSQIAMACAIESLLILRKLTERLADKELVKAANQEAQKMVDAVLLKEDRR